MNMTRQELCAALDAQLAAAQEQVCVLAVPLAGGVPLYERGAGRRAVSASTIKVFILLAALDEVRRGRLALDTPVAVTAEDILPDTGVFVDGPGMHPLEELLVWMIVLSDNTATNVLIGLLGAECINAAACSVGTMPACWMAPPYKSSFSVSVVLPASGCEMIANVRRLSICSIKFSTKILQTRYPC